MHVTLRQLHVFQAVARHLSFTRAAEELHLSQPAVSMQVRQLEESVGLPLFEKTGRQISLTEAGTELNHYSQNICRELDEAAEVMESMKGVNSGHLKIAVASTINYFAPRLLAAFSKIYPGIELSLLVTNRESLVQLLKENEEDLVLMGLPPEEMELEWEPFMENPLVVIAAPDHPLAGKKNISMQELAEETFVIRETGSGTRIAIERLFDSAGLKLKSGMQMTRNEAIKQAVRAGMGVSIVSAHTIELELETGRLAILDVDGFPLIRHWHLVHRKGKRLSPAARAFRDFVMENATSI
ncbi:LysR family transcriptional regulator [Solemya velum gill symbiont]|uniref:LysR family transcriptional regulator n=1 Tax=Solemya velum gill symbiont TaxID=2340 RepID=UPI0009980B6F|nr:LysR family transcriptional regulator [Solemya velum gill symbiont]OOZ46122.1 LysR family transcriptional regulator [Solemya velum gill symbiont]OOZ47565.1 LysR family transcriptional regulator [Solemya velum gill symbiont]OOZ50184.1 LysR family transcriptional regulator [Solemya velum gill symbiont]OOZ52657.1 LysR family transcriptional regulator [Solemya velum gill symbiont]OOZ55689.1 LysR family transcriptional regulator [Solemya velum gill symbiont]